jgi:archaellum component FlaC
MQGHRTLFRFVGRDFASESTTTELATFIHKVSQDAFMNYKELHGMQAETLEKMTKESHTLKNDMATLLEKHLKSQEQAMSKLADTMAEVSTSMKGVSDKVIKMELEVNRLSTSFALVGGLVLFGASWMIKVPPDVAAHLRSLIGM